MKLPLSLKYALAGACIVPVFGFLALSGTGHRGDLYRYIAPLLVGSVSGLLLGQMRQRWLDKMSELSAAHDLLYEQEEKYREIYNAPGEPIIVYSPTDGRFLETNNALLDVFGYTREEARHLHINDISEGSYPYNARGAQAVVRKAIAKGTHTFEWYSKKKNGDLFWTEIVLKKAHFKDQDFLIATIRDIDDRKKAEKELINEKERLSVTLRSIGDGVITTDISGRVLSLNKVAESLTGWSNADAEGTPSTTVFNVINEKTGLKCASPIQRVLELGRIIGIANHTALIAKDGTVRSIADSGAPIRDQESKIIGVVLVFRDVTHENLIEEELVKVKKLESIGVLAGGIAHDFNNILSAILGNIELAGYRIAKDDPETATLLSDAQKATLRASKLTAQLLTFSKGGAPIKEATSLAGLITDSADFVLHGSNVVCTYSFPKNLWRVDADSGQISQVIQNVILNAKHAMPEGGAVSIQCANVEDAASDAFLSVDKGDYVRISIQDNGIGISKELVDKIFDPYFTTKQEGSGLGLAICHSIINKHDGYLIVDSNPGKGTTFTIYLPASQSTDQHTSEQLGVNSLIKAARIMVMDDEEMLRTVAKAQLTALGHDTVLVPDGEQAITSYQEQQDNGTPVDLVIMDLTIPDGMGGQEATEKLLKIDPDAKIIVTSGYSNDPVMANYKEYGFRAAVAKPFDLKELSDAIASVL
jgi:PAS domain S-box-containing protein